jgi:hypothetical protein
MLDAAYFRERYAASPDPYGLADRWYEARKYAVTAAPLPAERYAAEALAAHPGLARLARYRDPDFNAEVYTHAGGDLRSVAQFGGIV